MLVVSVPKFDEYVLSKIKKDILPLLNISIIYVLSTDFITDYMSSFEAAYTNLLISPYPMSSEDLTSPERIKPSILNYVRGELTSKISSLNPNSDLMSAHAVSATVLGFPTGPPKASTDELKLFFFYLHGTIGEFAFITEDTYNKIRPGKDTRFGRFGTGFLIPLEEYKGRYNAAVRGGVSGVPSPDSVRHPFSGSPEIDLFGIVQRSIDIGKYINKAIELTKKGIK